MGFEPVASAGAEARLHYLTQAFDREVSDIDLWSWTWGGIYTAGTIAEGTALAITTNHGTRVDLTVGVIATGFGALSLSLLPLTLTLPMRSASSAAKSAPPADVCLALAHAEQAMFDVAKKQAFSTGIVGHLGNIAVNVGIALILGLGYGRWGSAALSGGLGLAVGEVNAFTQPHHLKDVVAHYRAGELVPDFPKVSFMVHPILSREMSGAAVGVSF